MKRLTTVVVVLVCSALSACSWTSKLKFWDSGPVIAAGKVELHELRRALVCDTPTEAAVVRLFDSAQQLREWDSNNILQLARIELPADSSFVLVEQGKRHTGGYSVELRERARVGEAGVLKLTAEWVEPAADRMLTQIETSLCVLVAVEPALYPRVELYDKNGTFRAGADIQRD